MDIDLDDEEAFFSSLGSRMQAQALKGIEVGKDNIDENTHTGFSVKRKPLVEPQPLPVPYEAPQLTKKLGTVDLESDPFKHGRDPKAFACGFATKDDEGNNEYIQFWGDDCVEQFFYWLTERVKRTGEDFCIYAHFAGWFDFNFFMDYLDADSAPFTIDGKIVKCSFAGVEFRDSFRILPVPLKKLKPATGSAKLDIEFWKMERIFREEYKDEISTYLQADCITLLDAVADYIKRFGWRLTVAGTALPYLESFHGFDRLLPEHDTELRPFFSGGRVQCFDTGILIGNWTMVDANSMYAGAMANFNHPVSCRPRRYTELRDDTDFAVIEVSRNDGCLGRPHANGLDFTQKTGTFFATIHEINAGLDTGTLDISRVLRSYSFTHKTTFKAFVEHFSGLRLVAIECEDELGNVFYKLIPNSAYGKFAMNSSKYQEYKVNPTSPPLPLKGAFEKDDAGRIIKHPNGWRPSREDGQVTIWQRPSRDAGTKFVNVATAASITGAARSVLWRALCSSTRPLYSDTDSIICEQFNGDLHPKRLGSWKVEAEGDAVCIAGKKMYAFLSTKRPDKFDPTKHEEIVVRGNKYFLLKKAHKGVQLTGAQIVAICGGEVIEYRSDAPTFKIDGSIEYSTRKVQITASKQGELFG